MTTAPPLTEAEIATRLASRVDTLRRLLGAPNDCPDHILREQRRLIREMTARLGPDSAEEPL